MRTEKIVIKNMGPFIDTEIDYTKVGSNGVVLIAGDTGAGKSTIYDAITYALFGKTSGGERDAGMLHNRTNNQTMFVSLNFSERGKRYRIQRLRYASGGTKMSLFYIENGKEREELKRKDISGQDFSPQTILEKEILHMDYEQFVKCSMLAQGKFREVLTEESKRGKVLAGLFKTSKLGRLVQKINEDNNSLAREVTNCKNKLEEALKDIKYLPEQASEFAFCDKNIFYLDLDGNETKFKELLETERKELEKLNKDNGDLQDEITKESQLLVKAQQYAKDRTELEKAEAQLPEAERSEQKALEAYTRAVDEMNKEAAYTEQKMRNQAILDDFAELPKKLKKYNKLEDDFAKKNGELEESLHEEGKLDKDNESEEKRLNNLPNYGQEEEALNTRETILNTVDGNLGESDAQKKVVDSDKKKLEKEKNTLGSAEKALQEAEKTKTNVDEAYAKFKDLEKEKSKLVTEKNPLDNLKNLLQERSEKLAEKEDKQKEYEKDKQKYSKDKKEYDDAYQLFLDNQAGILAQKLEDAEICPVCGAAHIHFGQPAKLQSDVKSEAEINKLKIKADKSAEKQSNSSGAIGTLEKHIVNLEDKIKDCAKAIKELGSWKNFEELETSLATLLDAKIEEINQLENEIAKQAKIYVSAQNVEACNKAFNIAKDVFDQEEKAYKNLLGEYNTAIALLAAKNKTVLNEFLKQGFIEDSPELQEALINCDTNNFSEENQDTIAKALELGRGKLEDAKSDLSENRKTLNAAKAKAKQDKENLDRQKKKLTDLKNHIGELKEDLARLKTERDQAKNDYDELKNKLDDYNQKTIQEETTALEQKIQDNKTIFTNAQKQKEDANENLTRIRAIIENKTNATKNIIMDTPKVIENRIEELQDKLNSSKRNYEIRNTNLALNKSAGRKIHEALQNYHKYNRRLAVLKPMAEFVAGKEKQGNKIDLETFAQGIYLDQVVRAANQILQKLSKHRYKLKRRISTTDTQKGVVTGLQLDVFDSWSGSLRDVKSMSGGEGFMASMALALGLAEVTKLQHGATSVESLFIDEGFGTLDAASLEQIMELLNELSGSKRANGEDKTESEKRMVTIISHLDELGKTVSKQFVIDKSQQGSTIRYRDLNQEHH